MGAMIVFLLSTLALIIASNAEEPPRSENCPPFSSRAVDEVYQAAYQAYRGNKFKQAAETFKKAADKCHAGAEFMLGVLFHRGLGVPQDYQQAMHWYRRAAKQGTAEAQSNIGLMYKNGLGVSQDYREAMQWYRLAADQGDAISEYQVGKMYAEGLGVQRDMELAREWIGKAAAKGKEDAKAWLAQTNTPSAVHPSPNQPIDLRTVVFLMGPNWIIASDKTADKGNLLFRRYGIVIDRASFACIDQNDCGKETLLKMASETLTNSMVFTCRKDGRYRDHIMFHLPAGTSMASFALGEWVPKLDIRVLSDDGAHQFSGEFIRGDLFIDVDPAYPSAVLDLLNSKRLTVEFGSQGDRLSLAAEEHFGFTAVDTFIRGWLSANMQQDASKLVFLTTDQMLSTCVNFKRTGKVVTGNSGKYWIVWGSTSCPDCDPSKGKTSVNITIGNGKSKRITSEGECKRVLDIMTASAAAQRLSTDLHCIGVDNPDKE